MLYSADLGPQYWSYALTMAIHVKNHIPHLALKKSPYEVLTNTKLKTRLHVFGSKVYAGKPGSHTTKLDDNIVQILSCFYCHRPGVQFIDEESGAMKSGTHFLFDEGHMSMPAQKAPLVA